MRGRCLKSDKAPQIFLGLSEVKSCVLLIHCRRGSLASLIPFDHTSLQQVSLNHNYICMNNKQPVQLVVRFSLISSQALLKYYLHLFFCEPLNGLKDHAPVNILRNAAF
jgi:hypothetical protein